MDGDEERQDPRAAGGIARASALSPEKRSEIAKKAAKARWGAIPRATHEGILKVGDVEFPCSVLEDQTRVLTETNFMKAMGMYRSGALSTRRGENDVGAKEPLYLAFKNLKPYVSKHLSGVHSEPVMYQNLRGGKIGHGIRADLIPKICEVWIDARTDGVLGSAQLKVAAKADILLRSLARVGIIALVDEATGYQAIRPQDALQKYLEMILRKELAAWSKRFPDEFYENIYKLKGWTWPGMGKNRYSVVAHYTRDLVYQRIAPSLLKELEARSPKNDKGARPNKLHQWLTDDVGHPMLAQHMHSLLMFQRLALANGHGWVRFVRMVDQVMPKKGQNLELPGTDLTPNVP